MIPYEKCVSDIIQLVPTEIVSFVEQNGIDAIVNAANPTLMGSNNSSVDYSIHQKIDDILQPDNKTFNKIIKDTADHKKNLPNETIRCRRGQAVVTAGGKNNQKQGIFCNSQKFSFIADDPKDCIFTCTVDKRFFRRIQLGKSKGSCRSNRNFKNASSF